MIQNIVFDLGGVLIDWDPRYLYRDIFKAEEDNDTLPKTNASPYELKNYFVPQYTDFPMNQNPIPLAC